MSEVFEGDEWRHLDNPELGIIHPPPAVRKLTRAAAQSRLDDLYAEGRITIEQWRARTDIIGEPNIRCYNMLCALT